MEKFHYEGDVENGTLLAKKDGVLLFELNGYGAEGQSSLIEEVNEYFPDFSVEADKHYLVVRSEDIHS